MGQDEPVEAGSDDASTDDKLAGLVEQMRGDVAAGNVNDVAAVLRERLDDAGIQLSEDDFEALLRRVQGV